jgi:hypothetical protein
MIVTPPWMQNGRGLTSGPPCRRLRVTSSSTGPAFGRWPYRMLGSLADADDAVQDTWLRLSRSGAEDVENLGGWLTTITARCA